MQNACRSHYNNVNYVFTPVFTLFVCLLACLLACRTTQKLLNRFSKEIVEKVAHGT